MKRLLHIFSFIWCATALYAQSASLAPGNFSFDLDGSEAKQIGFELKNTGSEDLEWYWTVGKGEGVPAEWELQVCDQVLCWDPGFDKMPLGQGANMLAASASTSDALTYIKVFPNGVAGKGEVEFCIYADTAFTQKLVCSELTTSINDTKIIDLKIYPNPAEDYIGLQGDKYVARIDVHDILGKKHKSFKHTPSKTHDISDLRNGLYLVRLYSPKGKLLKSLRLSKR